MQLIDYQNPDSAGQSLKQKLVTAVANGDEHAAQELRLLLKMNTPEQLRGNRSRH